MKWWKKYGAVALSAVVLTGACVETQVLRSSKSVNAEETEETQRVTLNIVTDDDDQKEEEIVSAADAVGANETLAEEVSSEETENSSESVSGTSDTEAAQSEEPERVTLNRGGSSSAEEETDASDTAEVSDSEEAAETTESDSEDSEVSEETEASEEIQLSTGSGADEAVSGIVTTDVSAIVEQCMPSIVTITCVTEETVSTSDDSDYYYYYYDEDVTEEAETEITASGIIIAMSDTELLIATNYHVVSGAESLTVGFSVDAEDASDLTASARVKGTSSTSDLAVVAVELSDIEESVLDQLAVATLGSSDELKVGQAAISISNALGYGQSVTVGVISALGREVDVDGTTLEVIVTDAAANASSSGGALLNAAGEVIGIGVSRETGDDAEGIAYAIPIDDAIPVLEQLINKETRDKLSDSERGYIGATVLTVSDEAIETYNMPAGAFVYEVTEGSAAEEAGIMSGDIISGIEGESVSSSTELIEKMSYYAPGETITLEVQTSNNGTYEAREVEVTLQAGSSSGTAVVEEEAEEELIPDEEDGDSADDSESSRSQDDFGEGFDDGFEDGFEDYNSQFN